MAAGGSPLGKHTGSQHEDTHEKNGKPGNTGGADIEHHKRNIEAKNGCSIKEQGYLSHKYEILPESLSIGGMNSPGPNEIIAGKTGKSIADCPI